MWQAMAQPSPFQTGLDNLAFLAEVDAGHMAILEKVRALHVQEADQLLRSVIDHTMLRSPEKAEAAARLLGELPGIPELYEKRLAELPPLYENSNARINWMKVIERIQKRWALNLLAKYLLDDRPLDSKYDAEKLQIYLQQTGNAARNRFLAAAGMVRMCRKDNLPIKRERVFIDDESDVELMRQWWRKNADQPDSFFFSNPDATFETLPVVRSSPGGIGKRPVTAVAAQVTDQKDGRGNSWWLWGAAIMLVLSTLWLSCTHLRSHK